MSIINTISRQEFGLSKLFFYLLLVFLPFGTRKIIFTDQSIYNGFHIFYHNYSIYLTDFIIFSLMLAWLWEKGLFHRKPSKFFTNVFTETIKDPYYRLLGIFWLILAISTIVSRETNLSLFSLVKFAEFFILFAYIRENFKFSREKSIVFWLILAIFSLQSLLAGYQYVNQESLGLKVLGEELLRPGIKGIAEFVSRETINPFLISFFPYLSPISDPVINIRGYGTLPHPNVLAGLLFAGLVINLWVLYSFHRKLWPSITLFLVTSGFILTFSRFAWAISALAVIIWFGMVLLKIRHPYIATVRGGGRLTPTQVYRPQRLVLIILVMAGTIGFNLFLFGQPIRDRLLPIAASAPQEDSLNLRKLYNDIALAMVRKNPLTGVGLNNFILEMENYSGQKLLPYMHQPVHNIYLLLASEAGIPALAVFLIFLYYIMRRALETISDKTFRYSALIIFFGFLAIGLFDHYFLTIQQGSLIFWTLLGFLSPKSAESNP